MLFKSVKSINIVMMVLFLLSVAVQYNDPDPVLWMLMYGLAALACLLFLLKKLQWWIPVLIGAAAMTWASLLIPAISESPDEISLAGIFGAVGMKTEGIELAREMGGLMIVVCWMAIVTIIDLKENN